MTTSSAEKRVVVEATPAALATRVADRFLTRVRARTRNGRIAHIALTGGSMGGAVLRAASEHPRGPARLREQDAGSGECARSTSEARRSRSPRRPAQRDRCGSRERRRRRGTPLLSATRGVG